MIKFDIEIKFDKAKQRLAAVAYKIVLQKGKKEIVIRYSQKY